MASLGYRTALTLAAMAALLGAKPTAAANRPDLSITLTGQSLVVSDIRVDTPSFVPMIRPLLTGDVVFTDFETTVMKKGDSLRDADPHAVYGEPVILDVLQAMGFNLFAFSNNHSFDIGTVGVVNALHEGDARHLAHAGTGNNIAAAAAPAYLDTPHGKVALVAMASGLIRPGGGATPTHPGVDEIRMEGAIPNVDAGHPNPEDAQRILQSIREAAKHSDLVIAYHHNHVYDKDFVTMMRQELPERLVPPKWIKKWAHEEVDAGADIVVMHGAPLLQGVEIYRGRPIFYDMGNFIFQLPLHVDIFEPVVYDSVVAHVDFHGKTLQSITLDPVTLNIVGRGQGALAQYTRGLPAPVTGERAGYILQRIIDASRPFGTNFARKGDAAELVLAPRVHRQMH